MYSLDILVQNYFSLIRTPALTELMYLLTIIFNFSVGFVFLTIFVAILIYFFKGLRYSFMFLLSLSVGAIMIYILKMIFDVNRPLGGIVPTFGSSFPSYHATIVTIFFVMLMYILADYFKKWVQIIFNIICIVAVLLVSFSRVYLGVHWVSDVFVGILLGLLVCYVFILLLRRVMVKWINY